MTARHRQFRLSGIVVAAFVCLTVASVAGSAATTDTGHSRFFRYLMGASMRIEVYGGDPGQRQQAADEAFAAIADVDYLMSDYRADSELTRLNRTASSRTVPVSAPLFAVLDAAARISEQSHGAFDVTIAPLAAIWRGITQGASRPEPQALATVVPLIGYRHVILDRDTQSVRFDRPGVQLELEGIAKGFAAEIAAGSLKRRGLTGAVDADGHQHMVGLPPGKHTWSLGVVHPDRPGALLGVIETGAGAVSTVADGRHASTPGGVHARVLDPRSLEPAGASLSATVVADDGTMAAGLARAVFVLGPEKGMLLLQTVPGAWGVVTSRRADGHVDVRVSPGHERAYHPVSAR